MSQNYDYSNQSAEDALGGYMSPNLNSASAQKDNLIQTVNTDGSNIFYHITEVPDAHPQDNTPAPPINYNEDNVLTTPMVREEMARNQLLKQKNRQRRKEALDTMAASPKSTSSGSSNGDAPKAKQQRLLSQQRQQLSQAQELPQPIQIKSEQDPIDPMMFLNVYPDSSGGMTTPDPNLISPNLSEDSRQSTSNNGVNFLMNNSSPQCGSNNGRVSQSDTNLLGGGGSSNSNNDLYNPSSFMTNDMPTEIFEVIYIATLNKIQNLLFVKKQNQMVTYKQRVYSNDRCVFNKLLPGI